MHFFSFTMLLSINKSILATFLCFSPLGCLSFKILVCNRSKYTTAFKTSDSLFTACLSKALFLKANNSNLHCAMSNVKVSDFNEMQKSVQSSDLYRYQSLHHRYISLSYHAYQLTYHRFPVYRAAVAKRSRSNSFISR